MNIYAIPSRFQRLMAYFIDIFPILFVWLTIAYLFFDFGETMSMYLDNKGDTDARGLFIKERNQIRNLTFLTWIVYCTFMEASSYQGTLGKRLMDIKVVDENGNRLDLFKAFLRNALKVLSIVPLFIGILWIIFDKKGQAWHDKLSKSIVVKE
jgi:uncharacterized RDD family membrane protein YckC